ncbi:MAG: hypothetical protein ACYCOO_01570 [Chitinophagaceae bacterium]
MKKAGIVLVILGIIMIFLKGFNVETQKKVVDLGSLQISHQQDNWIGWPTYAGVAIAVIGVVLIVSDRRKSV